MKLKNIINTFVILHTWRTPTNLPFSRREETLQRAFYASEERVRMMAMAAGAAMIIYSGETTIGTGGIPPITEENNPKLYRAYQAWLKKTGRNQPL